MIELTEKISSVASFWIDFGWSKDREVRIQNGRAYLEIAEQGHCSTCQRRISESIANLTQSGVDFQNGYLHDRYPADASTLWIGVKIPADLTSVEELKDYISKVFGFKIRYVHSLSLKS